MKKITTLILSLLCLNIATAQDIKTKKNKIVLDKKEIAQISNKKTVYSIKTLEGTPVATIESIKIELTATSGMTYYSVTLPDSSKSKNINNPGNINAFFPEKKLLLDFAYGPFKLLTSDGIDTKVLDQIFESDQSDLDKMLDYRLQSRKDVRKHIKILEDSKIAFNSADPTAYGYIKGFNDFIKLGNIDRKTDDIQKRYRVMDNNGNALAIWNAREDNMLRIPEHEGVYYIHHNNASSSTSSLSSDSLAKAMLGYLLEKNIITVPSN